MLAQHDLFPYLTRTKNNTISTLDLDRGKEGGRENIERVERKGKEKVGKTG